MPEKQAGDGSTRYEHLPVLLKIVFLVFSLTGIALVVCFLLGILNIRGKALLDTAYYYLIMALFGPCIFLIMPARKGLKRVPWYDLFAAAAIFGISLYGFFNAQAISLRGFDPATTLQVILAFALFLLILEGGRRGAGWIYLTVCLVLGLYPLFAEQMPWIFFGIGHSFSETMVAHAFSGNGVIGVPLKVLGEILIGFLLFAGILIASGAGDFFLNMSKAIMGRFRGGPAKVSVLASGFMGSLSGSAFSNVVATGSVTIPAMKKMGYEPSYSGAIEACASTGGMFMPPVMGPTAFVMCVFLGMEYSTVMVAALLPSLLFYFGLLMQVDGHAAKHGLRGLPREEIPSLSKTLREGWVFLCVLVFLVWGLLVMRWSARAPLFATGLMFLFSFLNKKTMMTPGKTIEAFALIGRLITQATAMILPLGVIIAGLVIPGTAPAFSSAVVGFGGGQIVLILLMGIFICYLLGMVGMVTPAYIFLAVSMAPAIIEVQGLNELAVHMFIVYYAMLSMITPPVAGAAFIAAAIADASPMKTSWIAMRLGFVTYFIPIFFLFHPALILQGSLWETALVFPACLLGILFMAAALEGYLIWYGLLNGASRMLIFTAGALIAFPEWKSSVIGMVTVALWFLLNKLHRNRLENPAKSLSISNSPDES